MRSIGESCWGEDSNYEAERLTPTLRALDPFQGSRLFKGNQSAHLWMEIKRSSFSARYHSRIDRVART